MVKSMFAAVAGLRAHQAKMDVIGNNVANVNTYGYKKARATFRDQFYATTKGASDAGNVYGGGNPSQIGYGSQIGSVDVTFGTGGMAPTGNGMDVMISGNGFFLVGKYNANGYGTTSLDEGLNLTALNLTRVGTFNIDGQGNLVDSNSNYVYGYLEGGLEGKLEVITVPQIYMKANGEPYTDNNGNYYPVAYEMTGGDPDTYQLDVNGNKIIDDSNEPSDYDDSDGDYVAPMKLNSIAIGTDGTITGMNDLEQTITIGKIAIANVPNPNALEATSNGYYKAKQNTGVVTAEIPGEGSTGQLLAGTLEMANVDLAQEFTDMITTQRGFQANTRIITVTDEMLQELVNLKR